MSEQQRKAQDIAAKKRAEQEMIERSAGRLAAINQSSGAFGSYPHEDTLEEVRAVRKLCDYLGEAIKLPGDDQIQASDNLIEDILFLSSVRFRQVTLEEDWYRHENGPFIGTFTDGAPGVILPDRLWGYRVYNARTGETFHANKKNAGRLTRSALEVYRTFPGKTLHLKQIVGFITGEHIHKELLIVLAVGLAASVIQVLPALMSEQIFDTVIPEHLYGQLIQIIIILMTFAISEAGFAIISNLGLTRISGKFDISLMAAVWDRLLSLPIPFFYRYTTGQLLKKIGGVERMKQALSTQQLSIGLAVLFSFVNVFVMFGIHVQTAAYAMGLFAAALVISLFLQYQKLKYNVIALQQEQQLSTFNYQTVTGMQRVRASRAEARIYHVYSQLESQMRFSVSQLRIMGGLLDAFYMFFGIASSAFLYAVIYQQTDFKMGQFVAFMACWMIFQKTIKNINKLADAFVRLKPVYQDIKPIFETEPEYSADKLVPRQLKETLEVNHLTFRYGEYDNDILHDVSFKIEAGKCLGIVALSGSGKTTLLKVLMGFFKPTSGKVYYGGYDLETLDLRYLRSQLGVIMQNSKVAVQEVTKERKKFYFFDEATSHLDGVSQQEVIQELRKLEGTRIIIAQRLATVKYCDWIIVLNHGRVTRQGTPAELIGEGRGLFE